MPIDLHPPPPWQWALLLPSLGALLLILGRGLVAESAPPSVPRFRGWDLLFLVLFLFLALYMPAGLSAFLSGLPFLPRAWSLGLLVLIVDALTCLAVVLAALQAGLPDRALGLVLPRRPRNALAVAAACPLLLVPVLIANWAWIALLSALGRDPVYQQALEVFFRSRDASELAAVWLMAVAAAPLSEELLFRGVVYGALKQWTREWTAMLATSAAFAAYHVQWELLFPIFLVGLVLNWIYRKTGCLGYCVLFHALFNGSNLLLGG